MDRVRFGRALGYGARHAAKSLSKAVEAAAASNPASGESSGLSSRRASALAGSGVTGSISEGSERTIALSAAGPLTRPVGHTQRDDGHSRANPGKLRRSVWAPLATFSNVVGLQVSGTFFALLAAFLSQGLWNQRGAFHLAVNSPTAEKFYLHAVAFAVFTYFAVSSFVRAHRRQRQ